MNQAALDFNPTASAIADALMRMSRKPEAFTPQFAVWLRDNWPIWKKFENEADSIWQTGRRHYSARTILEVIRHHTALASNDPDFKVNNNVAPDLARLYMLLNPDREGFFERRLAPTSVRLV